MPNLEYHIEFDKFLFGRSLSEVHKWIDEPVKELGFNHRKERHDYSSVDILYKKFGCIGTKCAVSHLVLDAIFTSKIDIRKADLSNANWIYTNNIDVRHYFRYEKFYRIRSSWIVLRNIKTKNKIMKIYNVCKEIIPKKHRLIIEGYIRQNIPLMFYSKKDSKEDVIEKERKFYLDSFEYIKNENNFQKMLTENNSYKKAADSMKASFYDSFIEYLKESKRIERCKNCNIIEFPCVKLNNDVRWEFKSELELEESYW